MRRVSTSCATDKGAVTRKTDSFGKNTIPSCIACTAPVKRRCNEYSMRSLENRPPGRKTPDKEFKSRRVVHSAAEIGRRHIDLMENSEQRTIESPELLSDHSWREKRIRHRFLTQIQDRGSRRSGSCALGQPGGGRRASLRSIDPAGSAGRGNVAIFGRARHVPHAHECLDH